MLVEIKKAMEQELKTIEKDCIDHINPDGYASAFLLSSKMEKRLAVLFGVKEAEK